MNVIKSILILVLHVCIAQAAAGLPAESSPPSAFDIFERTWEEADDFTIPENVVFRYREILYGDSAEESSQVSYEVLYRRSGFWRFNRTEHGDGSFFDRVVTPLDVWAASPGSLTVLAPQAPPPKGRDYPAAEREFAAALRQLVFAGFQVGRPIGMVPRDAEFDGQGWRGTAASTDLAIELRGELTPHSERILARSYRYAASKRFPDSVGKTWSVSGWVFDEVLETWIARRIAERRPDGRLARELLFEGAERLDRGLLVELTKPPELDLSAIDPLRGTIRFADVFNLAHYWREDLYPEPETEAASGTAASLLALTAGLPLSGITFIVLITVLAFLAGRWSHLFRSDFRWKLETTRRERCATNLK